MVSLYHIAPIVAVTYMVTASTPATTAAAVFTAGFGGSIRLSIDVITTAAMFSLTAVPLIMVLAKVVDKFDDWYGVRGCNQQYTATSLSEE